MRYRHGVYRFVGAGILLLLLGVLARAEEMTTRDAQRYGVDIVLLKGDGELRGAVLQRDKDELRMAVQRSWLENHQPEMLATIDQENAQQRATARTEIVSRIDTWITARAGQTRLLAVLKQERERLQAPVAEPPEPTQFVEVKVPAERVRRVYTAAAASRQLALVAWSQQLDLVEQTTVGALKKSIEKQTPDWATQKIDLADRLPAGAPQSPDEWAARQAIFEFEYGEPLEFQGTGNLLVRTGAGAEKPDMAALLASAAQETLTSQLGALGLDTGASPAKPVDWKSAAQTQARDLDRSGFSVTRIPQITGTGPATVEVFFFARLKDGDWHPIWSDAVTTDPASIKPAEIDRLKSDPQVQEILKVTQTLSLGDSAGQALRFGAAVQTSQQQAATRLFEFRQRYNRRLDSPPLTWTLPRD